MLSTSILAGINVLAAEVEVESLFDVRVPVLNRHL